MEEEEDTVEKELGGVVMEEEVANVIWSERGGDGGVNAGSTHGLAMLELSSVEKYALLLLLLFSITAIFGL